MVRLDDGTEFKTAAASAGELAIANPAASVRAASASAEGHKNRGAELWARWRQPWQAARLWRQDAPVERLDSSSQRAVSSAEDASSASPEDLPVSQNVQRAIG